MLGRVTSHSSRLGNEAATGAFCLLDLTFSNNRAPFIRKCAIFQMQLEEVTRKNVIQHWDYYLYEIIWKIRFSHVYG